MEEHQSEEPTQIIIDVQKIDQESPNDFTLEDIDFSSSIDTN